uniref:Fibronectin type-III domain-containing protein n=1 Tax=Leptobrachium leishanense TaxID=445787 RepID=A0A8C5WIZ6_9ANUR
MSDHRYSMIYLNYLLTVLTLQSAVLGDLNCTYNAFDVVSCTWNTGKSSMSAPCSINATQSDETNTRNVTGFCTLPPAVKHRGCKLQMTNARKTKNVLTVSDQLNINVNCSGVETNPVSTLVNFKPYYNIRLDPPSNVGIELSTDGLWNLSWVFPTPDYIINALKYEVFYKQKSYHSWQNATMIPIRQNGHSVVLRSLLPTTEYEARVRVYQNEFSNGQWSDYSQPVQWTTLREDSEISASPSEITSVWVSCTSILVLLILVPVVLRSESIKKILWVSVPDPSRFFDPLISTHKGNFQKWLSSPFEFSDYSLDPSPDISPVDIRWNNDKCPPKFFPSGVNEIPTDNSGQSMSSFSNQGYFFFQFPTLNEATNSSNASFSYGCLDQRSIPTVLQNVSLPSPVAGEETPLFHADYLSDPMTVGIGIQNRTFEVDPIIKLTPLCTMKMNEEQDEEGMNKEELEASSITNHQPNVENALPVIPEHLHPSFQQGDMKGGYFSLSTLHQQHYCQWV